MNCYGCLYCCFNVVCLWLFTEEHIHWEHSSRNVKSWSPIKILLELHCIHRGRHDNQLKIVSPGQDLLYQTEQNISI